MKVICIDNSPGKYNRAHRLLTVGEIYTACQCPDHSDAYQLEEVHIDSITGQATSFLKRRFIPLSNIDEVTVAEARYEAEANRLDKEWYRILEQMLDAI